MTPSDFHISFRWYGFIACVLWLCLASSTSSCNCNEEPKPPFGLGYACQASTECISGNCDTFKGQQVCIYGTLKVGEACADKSQCATGQCVPSAENAKQLICGDGQKPPPTTKKKTGEGPCKNGEEECEGKLCLRSPGTTTNYCTLFCQAQSDCPTNYGCIPLQGGNKGCARGVKPPPPKKKQGEACKGNEDCDSNLCFVTSQGSYCSRTCQTRCEGAFLCRKVFGRSQRQCLRFEGGSGGLCSQEDLQILVNCTDSCPAGAPQKCVDTCREQKLKKECRTCLDELDKCPAKNKCDAIDKTCCVDKKVECSGKPS